MAANEKNSVSITKIEIVGLALLALLVCYLAILARNFHVHFYDSYEYLNNAGELAGIKTRYDLARPPFFTIILFPFAYFAKVTNSIAIIERAPYFLMIASGAGAIVSLWRLMRGAIAPEFAIAGALALALNQLYLHYWPFLMPEVTACLLVTLYWLALARKHYLIAGLMLGITLCLRYQLAPLAALGLLFLFISEYKDLKQLAISCLKIAVSSLLIFITLHEIIFSQFLTSGSFISGMLEVFNRVRQFGNSGGDSIFQLVKGEFTFLDYFVTLPIVIIAVLGMIKALVRRERIDLIFLIWFWGIFISITLGVRLNTKDARYMLPALPALYYLFALGLSFIWQYIARLLHDAVMPLRLAMLCALSFAIALSPIAHAGSELNRLNDSFYQKPIARDIGNFLKANLTANDEIFWAGDYFTQEPANYQFCWPERLFFFDLFANAISFYTGRACYSNFSEKFIYADKQSHGALVVINQNQGRNFYEVASWNTPVPLTVHRVERQIRFHNSGRVETRALGAAQLPFSIFISEDGKDELYLTEVKNLIIFNRIERQDNLILQICYQGKPLPEYNDTILFNLPGSMARSAQHSIANIDYLLVSQLSPPMASFN